MEYSRTKVTRQLLKSAGIVLLLLLLTLLVFPLPVLAEGVTVSVDAPARVAVGNDFTVRINIANVTNLDAFVFRVRFDHSVINLTTTDTDSNGIYDSIVSGKVGGKTVKILSTVWKETGLISIIGEAEPFLSGATGSGYLAELHFHAVSLGTSNIGLEHYSLSDITAHDITATWLGSSTSIGLAKEESTAAPTQAAPTQEASALTPSASGPTPPASRPAPFNWPLVAGTAGGIVLLVVVVLLLRRARHD